MKKALVILLSLLMAICMLSGCGGDGGKSDSKSDATLKVINYANGAQPEAMEPIASNYMKYSTIKFNIFSGITRFNEKGIAELAYAESVETSKDGLTWTFHILDDAKWSDGEKLDAKQWEESIQYHLAPEQNARSTSLYFYIKNAQAFNSGECEWSEVGCKADDKNNLVFTLENPCTYFLDLCTVFVPYRLDIMKANPDWSKKAETYITNGAFRVRDIQDQTGFYCEKNPYYFDADNVKIDQLNFLWIDDEAVEFSSYKNGSINVSDSLNKEAEAEFLNSDEYKISPRIGVKYLTIHNEHIPDVSIRQALSYAVDRETLKKILSSNSVPANGFVPYGIHWGTEQWRDVADKKNAKDGVKLAEYDPEKAKQLLADAGYPNGEGLPAYRYICYNTDQERAQALQQMWKQVGINVEIVPYEASAYWDVLDTDDWDIADDGWTGDFDDPNTNLFLWEHYREVKDDGTLKDARWVDEKAMEYDALMKSTYSETDYETRMETFRKAEQILCEQIPTIPVFYYNDSMLVKPEVKNVVKSYLGHSIFIYADMDTSK